MTPHTPTGLFHLCAGVLACLLLCSPATGSGKEPVRDPAGPAGDPAMPVIEQTVLRSRLIDRPIGLGDPSQWSKGDGLSIPLFDGEICRADIMRADRDIGGTATLTAAVREPAPGHLIAVTTGGRSLITITMPGRTPRYRIICDEGSPSCRLDEVTTKEVPVVPEPESSPEPGGTPVH